MTWKNLLEEISDQFEILAGCFDFNDFDAVGVPANFGQRTRPEEFKGRAAEITKSRSAWTGAELADALGEDYCRQFWLWARNTMQELGWIVRRETVAPNKLAYVYRRAAPKEDLLTEGISAIVGRQCEWDAPALSKVTGLSAVSLGRAMLKLGWSKKYTTRKGKYILVYQCSTSQTTSEKSPSSITATSP